ncbi:MAG TPA: hypothetical protein VGO93_25495, partial [Candidatus Xenobia bacterium]
MKRRLLLASLGMVLLLIFLAAWGQFDVTVGAGHPQTLALWLLRQWVYRTNADAPHLDPNDLGGWLAAHAETAQPFELYCLDHPTRPTAARRTIVLQPLGPMSGDELQVVNMMAIYAQAFFQVPARLEKPLPLGTDPKATWGVDKLVADDVLDNVL